MTAATIRKAIGAAVVAAVGSAYAVLTADGFDFGHVTGVQWQSVALAGLAAFTTVYHLPNASAGVDVSAPVVEAPEPDVDRFAAREDVTPSV